MTTIYDIVIYHKNCLDGFAGLCIFLKSKNYNDNLIIHPSTPMDETIDIDVNDKNIIIIDVAYNPKIIHFIANHAKKMLFIDHHITIRNDITDLHIMAPHEIIYDDKMSGASLTWKYFMTGKMPHFIKYIQDNDIGAWKYKHTLPFIAAMEIHYETKPTVINIKKWNKLFDQNEIKNLLKKGKLYQIYKQHIISIHTKRAQITYFPSKSFFDMYPNICHRVAQYKVAIYNGTGCPSTSLLGHNIVNNIDCDFCMIWTLHMQSREYVISLRSISTDVGYIAKQIGGGGHKYASAFSIPCDKIHIENIFVS